MKLDHSAIAIIGLGYVGLPLAVEFGKKRVVIGFDINITRIAELESGLDHTLEVLPDELKHAKYLKYTLTNQYKGNVAAAFADYNGGPTVAKQVLKGKMPSIADTAGYLNKIKEFYKQGK